MEWLLSLGVATGMRTLTPIALLCWFAYLKLLPENGWGVWSGTLISAIVFTVLAVLEYIGDTLPRTPSRLAPGPLAARLVFGAMVGALASHATSDPLAGGVLFGVTGALLGAYGGYYARVALARRAGRDLPVALCESLLAILIALYALHVLHEQIIWENLPPALRIVI
jgi:uncharacterized membrane protein